MLHIHIITIQFVNKWKNMNDIMYKEQTWKRVARGLCVNTTIIIHGSNCTSPACFNHENCSIHCIF